MYRQILHAITIPVILLNEDLSIQFINHAFRNQFGYKNDSIVSQPGSILIAEESLNRIHQYAKHSNPHSSEITDRLTIHIQHQNETWNIAVVSLSRLNVGIKDNTSILIQILSVENLENSWNQNGLNGNIYRELLEQLPGVTYLCKNDDSFSILYIGGKVFEILGYTPGEFTENEVTLSSLINPAKLSMVKKSVNEALKRREAFHLSYKMKHRNGHWVWMNETGKGIYNKKGELLFIMGYYTKATMPMTDY